MLPNLPPFKLYTYMRFPHFLAGELGEIFLIATAVAALPWRRTLSLCFIHISELQPYRSAGFFNQGHLKSSSANCSCSCFSVRSPSSIPICLGVAVLLRRGEDDITAGAALER